MKNWKFEDDIVAIMSSPQINWEALRNGRLLLTGGTGIIGRWLLETLQHVNDTERLNLSILVPSRRPEIFYKRAAHLFRNGQLTLITQDLTVTPLQGAFTHIVHAATDTNNSLGGNALLTVFRTIMRTTENVLELAVSQPGIKVLFLSSGAVYGQQPLNLAGVPETWSGSPDPQAAQNAYGEGKRAAETLCAIYRKQFDIDVVTARIFTLLGPLLPLDTHFAAGNFIRDALSGGKVVVQGNGQPIRSYLYPSDLVRWLLVLLTTSSRQVAYNIGSERAVSIAELAQKVAELIGRKGYEVLGRNDIGWNAGRYVPDTSLIRQEFGLTETVSLESAILNTAAANPPK